MKKIILALLAISLAALFISCESTKVVPEDYTSAQIIQLGQDAYVAGHYEESEYYYKTVIERYGTDPQIYVEAVYELGHIYVKTKQYDDAKACFNDILAVYEEDNFNTLPGTYKKLALIGLSKIPE